MPTYEYRCEACHHYFEQFQSITAPSLRKCPECGKLKLKRLISSGAGVIFKGSGFYETDYRSESYKQAAKAETQGSSGGVDSGKAGAAPAKETPAKTKPPKAAKSSAPAD